VVTKAELEKLRSASRSAQAKARSLTDKELVGVFNALKAGGDLKPDTADPVLYERLVTEVQASTAANESRAQLKERVGKMGKSAISLWKEISKLV